MDKIIYYNTRLKTYYETVKVVALKNLKLRYKNSMLGFLWTLINPLFMLSIFVFVFSKIINNVDNYPLYVLSGLIFWNFFVSSSNQMINKIIDSGGILKSVNIPPVIFPLSTLVSNLLNFLITFVPFFFLMMLFGYTPSFTTLLIVPCIVLFTVFTYGISMALASLNVFFRDIEMFWTTITPALFYATPVVYLTPEGLDNYMRWNPFAYFMALIRDVLYWDRVPSIENVVYTLGITIVAFLIGQFTYQALRKGFISNY